MSGGPDLFPVWACRQGVHGHSKGPPTASKHDDGRGVLWCAFKECQGPGEGEAPKEGGGGATCFHEEFEVS